MKQAGYSGTPLAKKLGIKPGFIIRLVNVPSYYFDLFDDLPEPVVISENTNPGKNFIHYFTKSLDDYTQNLPDLKQEIVSDGIIWISWPKKSSGVVTDINEDLIRSLALANGLVDIKVCAVDDTWSGLKLVIPVKDRPKK